MRGAARTLLPMLAAAGMAVAAVADGAPAAISRNGPGAPAATAAVAAAPPSAAARAASAASLAGLQAAIAQCRVRLDPALDVGYERVAARCPELVQRLSGSEWAAWLPAGWRDARNDLSAGSLAELGEALAREAHAAPLRAAPRTDALGPVLAALGEAASERGGPWQRFKRWLRAALGARDDEAEGGVLARLLTRTSPSQAVLETVAYVGLAIVVLLAALVVWNELRLAGLGRRRADAAAAQAPSFPAMPGGAAAWPDIERLPHAERPARVLELLVDALARARLLPPARALTIGEVAGRVALPAGEDRDRLVAVARVAEDVRYGDRMPADDEIEGAVARGRTLAGRLEAGHLEAAGNVTSLTTAATAGDAASAGAGS